MPRKEPPIEPKWLPQPAAAKYLGMCTKTFQKFAAINEVKPIEVNGSKFPFYAVKEIDGVFERQKN